MLVLASVIPSLHPLMDHVGNEALLLMSLSHFSIPIHNRSMDKFFINITKAGSDTRSDLPPLITARVTDFDEHALPRRPQPLTWTCLSISSLSSKFSCTSLPVTYLITHTHTHTHTFSTSPFSKISLSEKSFLSSLKLFKKPKQCMQPFSYTPNHHPFPRIANKHSASLNLLTATRMSLT